MNNTSFAFLTPQPRRTNQLARCREEFLAKNKNVSLKLFEDVDNNELQYSNIQVCSSQRLQMDDQVQTMNTIISNYTTLVSNQLNSNSGFIKMFSDHVNEELASMKNSQVKYERNIPTDDVLSKVNNNSERIEEGLKRFDHIWEDFSYINSKFNLIEDNIITFQSTHQNFGTEIEDIKQNTINSNKQIQEINEKLTINHDLKERQAEVEKDVKIYKENEKKYKEEIEMLEKKVKYSIHVAEKSLLTNENIEIRMAAFERMLACHDTNANIKLNMGSIFENT